jgi:hypothetical protein
MAFDDKPSSARPTRGPIEVLVIVVESKLSQRLDLPPTVMVTLDSIGITVASPEDDETLLKEVYGAVQTYAHADELTCIEIAGPLSTHSGVLNFATSDDQLFRALRARMPAAGVSADRYTPPGHPIHHPNYTEYHQVLIAPSKLSRSLGLPPAVSIQLRVSGISLVSNTTHEVLVTRGYNSIIRVGALEGIASIQFGGQPGAGGILHFGLDAEFTRVLTGYMESFHDKHAQRLA